MAQQTLERIADAFDGHNIKYRTVETENLSFIEAGYNIQGGPMVRFHFLSQSENGNDVQMRINGLMHKVSGAKRGPLLEACNRVNSEMRFLKFYLDKNGDLFGQADLPTSTAEDCVGENCFELFLRSMQILDHCYHFFPEAYFAGPAPDKNEKLLDTINALKELSENPLKISMDDIENDGNEK